MDRHATRRLLPLLILALMSALAACGPAPADRPAPLEGVYAITGNDPGDQAPYEGEVTLTRLGSGYAFRGMIADMHYEGVGLFDPRAGTLGLCFQGEEQGDRGVTLLSVEGEVLRGRWMYADDPDGVSGQETWTWRGLAPGD